MISHYIPSSVTEFLLGEDILVAPVIKDGARTRDIYLPKGEWRDENKPGAPTIDGPIWLRNYEATLDVLPYFKRIEGHEGHDHPSWTILLLV